MVEGVMSVSFEKDDFEGYGVYDVVFPSVRLGQSAASSFSSNFVLHGGVELVFLEAVVGVDEKPAGFRVSFNGVTITREFKPLLCVEAETGGQLCKLLYDVTPIVRSKESKSVDVVLENFSMNTVTLQELALVVLYRMRGARAFLRHYGGIMLLDPGELVQFSLKGRGALAASIVAFMPHADSKLVVNGKEFSGHGFNVFNVDLGDTSMVEIGYKGRRDVFPRKAVLLGLLASKGAVPRPAIMVNVERISDRRARVSVQNRGKVAAENVIIVSLSRGLVVDRKIIGRIGAGESRSVEIRVSEKSPFVRIIWRELGELRVKEVKL